MISEDLLSKNGPDFPVRYVKKPEGTNFGTHQFHDQKDLSLGAAATEQWTQVPWRIDNKSH